MTKIAKRKVLALLFMYRFITITLIIMFEITWQGNVEKSDM